MQIRFGRMAFIIIMTVQLSGCATIVSDTTQTVSFESEPSGATVKVDGLTIGVTPVSARLDKRDNQLVTFELTGYKTAKKELATKTDPWFFGNLITGGLFGSTTDFASGAVYEYSPDQYFVTLTPKNSVGLSNSRQQIKRYVVVVYDELRSAAARGEATTNSTFVSLLNALYIDPKMDTRVEALVQLIMSHPDPMAGANAIAERYY
ncbi:PEGA domain-containing protein [Salinisphaera sp.]|uniref:PEGA domain-containing protein n=1 Tax=Salinisphaera sp. TaxID=1914330 RepID=UPI000C5230F9|nr:PEGA domain-containing protein [Salinisphaera sp.]MAS09999.1 PEGA domain-containing protein [Salinisphaera sp.]|tara:strand:- start:370 stop:987 length:618 start_codon:yes stop_codon:yes gene_type:complete